MIPWPLQLITSGPFSPSLQHDYTLALLLPTTAAPQKAHVPILNLLSIISVFPALTHPYFQSPPGVGFSLWTSPISPVFRPIQGCASFHIPPSLLGASSGTYFFTIPLNPFLLVWMQLRTPKHESSQPSDYSIPTSYDTHIHGIWSWFCGHKENKYIPNTCQ